MSNAKDDTLEKADSSVQLARTLSNGDWLFEREGTYFRLNRKDIEYINKLVDINKALKSE